MTDNKYIISQLYDNNLNSIIPVLTSKLKYNKIEQNAHISTMANWLKTNPGFYRLTKELVDTLISTSNVIIDDNESGIITTPSYITKINHRNSVKVTHTLSSLLFTKPHRTNNKHRSSYITTYDVCFPQLINRNSYDIGGWWSAFSYIENNSNIMYKELNFLYKDDRSNDNQIHRADNGKYELDNNIVEILLKHKQVIVNKNTYYNWIDHYVIITIYELIELLESLVQPEFESICELNYMLDIDLNFKKYLESVIKLDQSNIKTPDNISINDINQLKNESLPEDFPTLDKHYIYQQEIDYKEYIMCKYKYGNNVYERYYCIILTIGELKNIIKTHDIKTHNINNSIEIEDEYY